MTIFKKGEIVKIIRPGARYKTSSIKDSKDFAVNLLNYSNHTKTTNELVRDTFVSGTDLLNGNWSEYGTIVDIDSHHRNGTQVYAVVFRNVRTNEVICCVYAEDGLELFDMSSVSTLTNTKSITKQDILKMLANAYRLGVSESRDYFKEDLRALQVYDTHMNIMFGKEMTYDNPNDYKESELPF